MAPPPSYRDAAVRFRHPDSRQADPSAASGQPSGIFAFLRTAGSFQIPPAGTTFARRPNDVALSENKPKQTNRHMGPNRPACVWIAVLSPNRNPPFPPVCLAKTPIVPGIQRLRSQLGRLARLTRPSRASIRGRRSPNPVIKIDYFWLALCPHARP